MSEHDETGLQTGSAASHISLDGSAKTALARDRSRIGLTMFIVAIAYAVILVRLVMLGFMEPGGAVSRIAPDASISAARPDIRDRNGETLATDIVTSSLYAEPRRIVDADEAVELLSGVLPELDVQKIYKRLTSKAGFEESEILALGIPGIGFRTETRRFYPNGETASHVVGHVNIDNAGIAGLEKYIDERGLKSLQNLGFARNTKIEPVYLSLDLRVQHIVRDELAQAMERYQAIAAGAVVLNVNTGEVVALASLPDYDPNTPVDALKKDRLNRMSAGLYEMGSTFKAFTTAMALDSGLVSMDSKFDASQPLRIAGFTINDFHGKRRVLSVPEVFIYSSNIGAAKMADTVGIEGHRSFLDRMGLLTRMQFELPEVASPVEPKVWRKISSVTISYGHGLQTTPLQTAVAGAALVNGGKLIPPTLFARSRSQAAELATQVVSTTTSSQMRDLLRLNVLKGSGKRAEVPGFRVGGKTGTAEKVINGRYTSDVRFNAFLAAFPMDNPQYVVLVILDEPKPEEGRSTATAGLNTAPLVANIIRRAGPILGVRPDFDRVEQPLLISQ